MRMALGADAYFHEHGDCKSSLGFLGLSLFLLKMYDK